VEKNARRPPRNGKSGYEQWSAANSAARTGFRRIPIASPKVWPVVSATLLTPPAQAFDYFLRTKMDLLVMGDVMNRPQ